MKDILTEKKMFNDKIIAKALKMNYIDGRILVSKHLGDKALMNAYIGLKNIQMVIAAVKKDAVLNRLDIKLKNELERKYANAEEVSGNLVLFGT